MGQMSEIVQKMGIDASQAIAELERLDKKFAQFGESLRRVAEQMGDANRKTSEALKKMGGAFRSEIPEAIKQTEKLHTSLALLSRIVFTQAIVRALSQLRRSFESTGQSAIEFQKRVALIRTIDDSKQSFDSLAASVRLLSNEFNIPLLEAADGLYQTLSNQVGNFGESLQFSAKAAQFAKATNSTLSDSVDLLSAALKGYGLSASETDRVASVFFTAIDKGRITASELANSFGRVDTIAADLGVSLEEVGGALAAISVRGTKTSEALTQFRAILSGMQKPSEEMRRTLEKLGFTSAQTAIQTLGLPGVLDQLGKSTGGSSEQLARLFPNIRGLSGASSLLADDLATLSENIREMQSAGRDFAKEKFLIATATDADRLTKEINKLRNAFSVELGQAVLKAGVSLSDFVGGADNVVASVKAAGPAIAGLAGSFALLRGSMAANKAELAGLSRGLGLLSLLPVAAGVGSSLGSFADSKLAENLFAGLSKQEELSKKLLERFEQDQAARRDAAKQADQAIVRSALEATRSLNRDYLASVGEARTGNAAMVESVQAAVTKILGSRQRLVDELGRSAAESEQFVKASADRVRSLLDRQADRKFDTKLGGLSEAQQVFALAQRANDLANQAAQQLRSTDPATVKRALDLFAKAQNFGEQAQQIADRADNRALETKAAKELESISNKQIAAEQQLSRIQADRTGKLAKERDAQQRLTSQLREQTKLLLENTGVFDSQNNQLSSADLAKRQEARAKALQNIAKLALNDKNLSSMGALGVADFVNRFSAELSRDPIRLAFDVEDATVKLKARLDQAFSTFKLNAPVDVSQLEKAIGRTLTTPDQINNAIGEVASKANDLRGQIDKALAGEQGVQELRKSLDVLFTELDQRANVRNLFPGEFSDGLRSQFAGVFAELQRLRSDTNITEEELNKLIEARNKLGQSALAGQNPLVGRQGFGTSLQALDAALQKLQQLQQLQQQSGNLPALQQQLQGLNSLLQGTSSFQAATAAIGQGVSPAQQIAAAYERAATAAERLAAASAATPVNRAFGGPMGFFASGGRGLDTIPAMLSPGEFVINAQSSRKFYSQLQAMNAGMKPVFREDGGSVVNNTVGDIVINGAKHPMATARAVMTEMRREMRRGSGQM
jgi:TP901 family phage tail tape measure protein